jgi:hypothetical protein
MFELYDAPTSPASSAPGRARFDSLREEIKQLRSNLSG